MPDILLLACTGRCLVVSGSLPHSSCGAVLEAQWEEAESRVMGTCRAGTVGLAPSLGDTWLRGQSPAHHFLVPQLEPSLGVIHTRYPALLHTPVPAARWASSFPWALSQMGAHRKVSIGARGRKNLPTEFSALMQAAGRGMIYSKPEASVWWRGQGKVFPFATPVLGWGGTCSFSTLLPSFPSTMVNSLVMGCFLIYVPNTPAWLLCRRLVQQWLWMRWRLRMTEGIPAHKLEALRTDSEHREQEAW